MVGFFAVASAARTRSALARQSKTNAQAASFRQPARRHPLALAADRGWNVTDTGLAGIGMATRNLDGEKSQD
jgi:hypothetical protein